MAESSGLAFCEGRSDCDADDSTGSMRGWDGRSVDGALYRRYLDAYSSLPGVGGRRPLELRSRSSSARPTCCGRSV